jgi:tetratricopeptide (TPR) repeat protein
LKWFGDPEPDAGSPWEKGERLAEFVRNQKTLLILDGLEPLQQPFREEEGRIRDPGLQSLVRELANYNPGLCVITSRLDVDDLKGFTGTTVENKHLEHLSDEAGMELLKYLGVKGTDDELKQAVRDFDGHALALMLLGTYLSIVYKGDIEKRDRIARLTKEKKYGGHARQVMESYEVWFKDQPELDILRIMGLFDRPAEGGAIEVLRADPPINGLTTKLTDLSHEDWQFALNNLRNTGLLAKEDSGMPDALDCHALIREHFGDELKQNNPKAWKEAHYRLYEYFKNQAKEYPDTIEEMSPLYSAVAHGCQAGRYQDAMDEVYLRRIQRRGEFFNTAKLGAFGADLDAISGFFDSLWDKPVARLTEAAKAFILNEAGFDLRALGRLKEAAQSMQAGLEARVALEDWKNAAIDASNLSELYLTIGDISLALKYANQSVDLADRSGDAFWRMASPTALADALHQAGRQSEAESIFREAEELQKDWQPEYPFMYSLQGFQYCDLLLSQGKYQEVLSRAEQTLEWTKEGGLSLLDIALDHHSLGRAHLLQALQEGSQDFTQAKEHLNQAVDGLRQAGTQHHVPRGLLARAELYIVQSEFDKAPHDIEEAMTIAERGEMGLHQADCHLECARLYRAMKDEDKAREHLAIAREMIEQMGYHRRDHEVKELESML